MLGSRNGVEYRSPPLFFSLSLRKIFVNSPFTPNPSLSSLRATEIFEQSIISHPTHTKSIKFGDHNENCGNTMGSYNTTVYEYDEDAQIMGWLSPIEPKIRHQGVRDDRFDGVGDWVLETKKFRERRGDERGADKAVLVCPGNPGVGMTFPR